MGDYQAQLAKDRHDFANIARVKLREVGRRDLSSFANIERVADLLGEWVMRLTDPKSEGAGFVRGGTLSQRRAALPIAPGLDSAPIGPGPHPVTVARERLRADDPALPRSNRFHRVEVGNEN